jgi:hypothetical protein
VAGAPGEVWANVNAALREGTRGLPGGDKLAPTPGRRLHFRNLASVPPPTVKQILAWADAHRPRTGRWPAVSSGPVRGVRGETWQAVDHALGRGTRGLPGGSSMPRLLAEHRGARNKAALPPLTEAGILDWAEAHHRRTGRWPTAKSGSNADVLGETWKAVAMGLWQGLRGMPGGDSLVRLLLVRGPGGRGL